MSNPNSRNLPIKTLDYAGADQLLLEKIDACVACGLCLTHCPTYQLNQSEAESPRGRIALARGLLHKQLTYSIKNISHIDKCLMCGTCEKVCPADVKFTLIIDSIRTRIYDKGVGSKIDRFYSWLMSSKKRLASLRILLKVHRFSGLKALGVPRNLKRLSAGKNIALLIANQQLPGQSTKTVTLFTGCVGDMFEFDTLQHVIKLLNFLGVRVQILNDMGCCGAVASHSGDHKRYKILQNNNKKIFDRLNNEIVAVSSGCAAVLQDYLQQPVNEICNFIVTYIKKNNSSHLLPQVRRRDQIIGVYLPCTLRNKLNSANSVHKLLRHYGIDNFVNLSEGINCCGAAGTYMYRNKFEAKQLRQGIIDKINAYNVSIVLTMNIGCRMHLLNHHDARKYSVIHPVSYIIQNCY